MGQLCCIGERSLPCPRNWCWIKNLAESDDWILTRGKVTWRISPLLQMSFSRFAAMATMSRPSTSPAPTSSVAMPSAVSFPSMNSNLMSFSSRREFLSTESSYLQTLTRVKTPVHPMHKNGLLLQHIERRWVWALRSVLMQRFFHALFRRSFSKRFWG